MTKKLSLLFAVIVFLMFGCGGQLPGSDTEMDLMRTYKKVLIASKTTWTMGLTAMGNLYRAGIIDDNVRGQAIDIGNKYREAHNLADTAWTQWAKTKLARDKGNFETAYREMMFLFTEFNNYINLFIKEK